MLQSIETMKITLLIQKGQNHMYETVLGQLPMRTIPHQIKIKPNHFPPGPQSLGLFPTKTTPHYDHYHGIQSNRRNVSRPLACIHSTNQHTKTHLLHKFGYKEANGWKVISPNKVLKE